jgi:hypothetical protein
MTKGWVDTTKSASKVKSTSNNKMIRCLGTVSCIFITDSLPAQRFAACPESCLACSCGLGAGPGVDSVWEQKKLEARKMLDCEASRTRQSPASGKRFLGWRSVVQGLLAVKEAACIKLEKELKSFPIFCRQIFQAYQSISLL